MQSNKPKDTAPERALRSRMHRAGLRFYKHFRALPGKRFTIDAAFPQLKIAVFLNGCFWHGCPEHGSVPKAHADFWKEKLQHNMTRDSQIDDALAEAGWLVVRAWEHDAPFDAAVAQIAELVRDRRARSRSHRSSLDE